MGIVVDKTLGEIMKKLFIAAALCISLTACADTSQISQQVAEGDSAMQQQLDRIEAQNTLISTGSAIILGLLLAATGIIS